MAGKTKTKKNSSRKTNLKKKRSKKQEESVLKKAEKDVFEKEEAKKKESENSYIAKWLAPESIKTYEEVFFYYLSFVGSVFMVVWSFYEGNAVTFFTFLVLGAVIVFQIYHNPKNIEYKIDLDGISVDDKIYRYKDIESFEVIEKDGFNILKIKLFNALFPVKEFYFDDQNPRYIRAALGYFLPEKEIKEMLFNYKKKEEMTDEEFFENLKRMQEINEKERRNIY